MSKTCHFVSIHTSSTSKGCRLSSIACRTSIHYYKHISVGKYSYSYHYNVYRPFRSSPYGQFFTGHFILTYIYYVRHPSKVANPSASSCCVLLPNWPQRYSPTPVEYPPSLLHQ